LVHGSSFSLSGRRGAPARLAGGENDNNVEIRQQPCRSKLFRPIHHGDQRMISPTPTAHAQLRVRFALWATVVMLLNAPAVADAQGLVQGVQQGAQAGNKAAGPVGGVLGGAIGGVVGVFTGVLGVGGQRGQPAPASGTKQNGPAKTAKAAKNSKAPPQPVVLTQPGAPELTAEQIVANSDADIDRIKSELNLTPDQEKYWTAF